MKIISTENMPVSNGHYSHCIEHNGILYLSGQLPIDPVTGKIPVTIEEQTLQALSNVKLILSEAGSSSDQVLQVRIYISDIGMWERVNKVYSVFFGTHKPARSVIPTLNLHFGSLIEIEAIAVINR